MKPNTSTALSRSYDSFADSPCCEVAVILCVTDDTRFIVEQLESIENQKNHNCTVVMSYDGTQASQEEYLKSLLDDLSDHIPASFVGGPREGFAKNFLHTLCEYKDTAEYYAFSDQDDVWEEGKLSKAIKSLSEFDEAVPAVYCSRTLSIDEKGQEVGLSPLFKKKPGFQNALVQSIAGGNTMVLNHAAVELVREVGVTDVVSHDWWVYMLVTGVGGEVIYDPWPSVRYRQHDKNLVGGNNSWGERLKRVILLFQGRFKLWNDRNISSLKVAYPYLTEESRGVIDSFIRARQSNLFARCLGIIKSDVYRQTLLGNIGLAVATLLKKL